MSSTAVWGALAGLVVATGYLVVGALVARRAWHARRLPLASFALFWLGVGAYGLVEAGWVFALLGGADALWIGKAVLHAKLVAVTAGFGGLVAYLARVYAGRTSLVAAACAYYGMVFVLLEVFYGWRQPVDQHLGVWGAQLDYARPAMEPAWTLVLAMLLVPPMLAALAYASLLRVAREPRLRRRIALTSASLLLFLLPTLLSWQAGGWYWWGLAEKGLGALAALGMLGVAWDAWRTGRGRADGLSDDLAALRARRHAALVARTRELV